MAKQVTVLGLEENALRGVQLDQSGSAWMRGRSESWSLVDPTLPTTSGEGATPGGDDKDLAASSVEGVQEEVVLEDRPLARAFKAAFKAFGTREVSLSLPLSKLLVKTVRLPIEAREDLQGAAQMELDGISPFPDEVLTPSAEIVAETDKELVVVMAALPEATSEEISEALTVAGLHVVRTDVTALAWLRALWPQICEKAEARHRLVLLNLDDGWNLVLLMDGAPIFLRGLGRPQNTSALVREITLSLLHCDSAVDVIEDVVVCVRGGLDEDISRRLTEFGPVRVVRVEDDAAGVEGAARREVEGSSLDVTPAQWTEDLAESRFRRVLKMSLGAAGVLWCVVMGFLFGVDLVYDYLTDRQRDLSREKTHAAAYRQVSDLKERVELIQRYADHGRSALEVLKKVSDSLPPSQDMTFASYAFVRGDKVRVQGSAGDREDINVFKDNLLAASYGDGGEESEDETIFSDVKQAGSESQMKNGLYRFTYECLFPQDEDGSKGGRK